MKPVLRAFLCVLCAFLVKGAPAFAQARVVTAGQDGVGAPKRTKTVNPVYPQEAMAQGIRGIVILEVLIDPQGKVGSAEVIRSIPGLDEAALEAVRKWEYEVTKVEGQPVSVKLTVPITFAMKVPEVTRAPGIPELRQGAAIQYPAGQTQAESVTAEVTLGPDGQVAEAEVTKGNAPFSVALLSALRTWRFAAEAAEVVLSFRVEADFAPPQGDKPRVEVRLTGLRRSEAGSGPAAPEAATTPTASPADGPAPSVERATEAGAPATPPSLPPPPAVATAAANPTTRPAATEEPPPASGPPAAAAPPASPPAGATPTAPATVTAAPAPAPTTTLPAPSTTVATPPASTPPAAVAKPAIAPPGASPPPSTPPASTPPTTLQPAGPPAPNPSRPGALTAAELKPAPVAPPVEVLSAPRPAEAPPPPVEPGVSAIKDVTLALGVPDLVRGRRPVPPPLARMAGTTGAVEVKFGVDASGATSVSEATGPQVLSAAATYTVQSWFFRRVTAERLHLVAEFDFAGETAKASIRPE